MGLESGSRLMIRDAVMLSPRYNRYILMARGLEEDDTHFTRSTEKIMNAMQ